MSCNNTVFFGYTSQKPFFVRLPFEIISSGTINGKDYYAWYDDIINLDLFIFWNNINNRWEFGYGVGDFNLIAFLNYSPSDCPFNPTEPFSWVTLEFFSWIDVNSFILSGSLTEEQKEEIECFEIKIWDKQCEFSKSVLKYLQLLQFGSVCCEALEKLKQKKRILKILNCYDTRDIPNNTTDYNTFSYTEIKKLLNN